MSLYIVVSEKNKGFLMSAGFFFLAKTSETKLMTVTYVARKLQHHFMADVIPF